MVSWIDIVILIITVYFMAEGWRDGIFYVFGRLLSLVASLYSTYHVTPYIAPFVSEKLGVSQVWVGIVSQIIVFMVFYSVIGIFIGELLRRIESSIHTNWISGFLGSLVAGCNTLLSVTFILLLILALPVKGTMKDDIEASVSGKYLISFSEHVGIDVQGEIKRATSEIIKFTTVEPSSMERLILDAIPPTVARVADGVGESYMLQKINEERLYAQAGPLVLDDKLTLLARAYSMKLLEERFFSHVDSKGHTVKERLEEANYPFRIVGENLAYAPTILSAHEGLMHSAGHRANIVNPLFVRVGIGIIDVGQFGKMVTQIFVQL